MRVSIYGISIPLTAEQIKYVNELVALRKKECNSFLKVLEHFGFKKVATNQHYPCYQHVYYNWYAEIHHHSGTFFTCWIVGQGIKTTRHYPGGWSFETHEELENELATVIDKLSNIDYDKELSIDE